MFKKLTKPPHSDTKDNLHAFLDNPHLTILKSSSEFDRNSKELIGKKDTIVRYSLTKKVDGNTRFLF